MASGRTTSSAVLAKCPACERDIHVTMALDVELHLGDEVGQDKSVPATVTLKGCEVRHDCMPRTMRDAGGSISTTTRPTPPAGPTAWPPAGMSEASTALRVADQQRRVKDIPQG